MILDDLLGPLDRRPRPWGARVVAMGVTGSGKSHALRALVARAAPRLDVVYVVDDGPENDRWSGQRRIDIADCAAKPLVARAEGGSNLVVLTGDIRARRSIDCEAVARDAWACAVEGDTVAVVFDELRRGCSTPGRWVVPQGELANVWTEGRKIGISGFAATNFPQEIPREALGQSDLLVFTLGGKEVMHCVRNRILSPEQAEVAGRLQLRDFIVVHPGALPSLEVHRL
jgi:hypothetical protein